MAQGGGGTYIKELSFLENFLLSGSAAVISKTAVAPIERVKLLVQSQSEMLKQHVIEKPYSGVIECTIRTFQSEGILPFWRGNLANCFRHFPTHALNFALKDQIKMILKPSKTDPYALGFVKNVSSGGIGSVISLFLLYSLDYARTRLSNDAMSSKKTTRQFNGLMDVYKQTLKTDGIPGLYRGLVVSCVGIFVYRGLYFGFYDTFKPILLPKDAGLMSLFALGYAVTVTSGLISYPIDTVRRRMMMTSGQKIKYGGSIDCFKQIIRKEGFMSLMNGAAINIVRGIAGAGVLSGFDTIKRLYLKYRKII